MFSPGALPAVMVPSGRKAGLSLAKRLERRVGTVVLVVHRSSSGPSGRHSDRDDLAIELPGRLRGGEALLRSRAQRSCASRLTWNFCDQVFGMPAGMLVRKGVVQAVEQHAVVELAVAHAVPQRPRAKVGRRSMFSMPPAIATATPGRDLLRAETIACAPEPQTRLTVIAGTATGRPT